MCIPLHALSDNKITSSEILEASQLLVVHQQLSMTIHSAHGTRLSCPWLVHVKTTGNIADSGIPLALYICISTGSLKCPMLSQHSPSSNEELSGTP
jgi:hypothetical protein